MDEITRQLYGRHWPRSVGVSYDKQNDSTSLYQWSVHSEKEWDLMKNACEGHSNIYTSICSFGGKNNQYPVNHMVSLDLDSPYKNTYFDSGTPEDLKLHQMREDPEVANIILGEVLDEASGVAEWADEMNIPLVGVFSGFGIHLHFLFRSSFYAEQELLSVAERVKQETEINTLDRQVIGDVRRILRVPNSMRTCQGRPTHVYTVPLSLEELRSTTPEELMELSKYPRHDFELSSSYRPPMPVYDDYLTDYGGKPENVDKDELQAPTPEAEDLKWYVETVLQLPCLAQRIMQPDPDHRIRLAVAARLLEMEWSVDEIANLFGSFNWVDFRRDVTVEQLRQIKKRGYSSPSCQSIQSWGKCVFPQESREQDCHVYGISGGDGDY